jgi:hypothetical protein
MRPLWADLSRARRHCRDRACPARLGQSIDDEMKKKGAVHVRPIQKSVYKKCGNERRSS